MEQEFGMCGRGGRHDYARTEGRGGKAAEGLEEFVRACRIARTGVEDFQWCGGVRLYSSPRGTPGSAIMRWGVITLAMCTPAIKCHLAERRMYSKRLLSGTAAPRCVGALVCGKRVSFVPKYGALAAGAVPQLNALVWGFAENCRATEGSVPCTMVSTDTAGMRVQ